MTSEMTYTSLSYSLGPKAVAIYGMRYKIVDSLIVINPSDVVSELRSSLLMIRQPIHRDVPVKHNVDPVYSCTQ